MADSRLYGREPEPFELPYPLDWTFAQRIPKREVDNYIRMHPELGLAALPLEEASHHLAMIYFQANQAKLEECASPHEREQYYLEQQAIADAIEKEKPVDFDVAGAVVVARSNYYRRKDELANALAGPMTQEGALIIEQNAKALIAVDRLLCIDERKAQEKAHEEELNALLRNVAKEFNEEQKKKDEKYSEFARNNARKYIENNGE